MQERACRAQRRASQDTFDALQRPHRRAGRPTPRCAALTATVTTLNPQLRFYGPFVTVCNTLNYFWTYLAEHFSEADITGQAQRALLNFAGQQDDSLGAMGATSRPTARTSSSGNPQYLQGQPYGAAVTPDGRADCEAGQRGFLERQARAAATRSTRSRATRGRPAPRGRPTRAARACRGRDVHVDPETGPYSHDAAVGAGSR